MLWTMTGSRLTLERAHDGAGDRADRHPRELTLPPADYPWDGIRRHSELRLRRRTLERLRRERRRMRVKRWLLRLLTLGWRGR